MSSPSQPIAVIAKLLDLSERRVRPLSREGVIPKPDLVLGQRHRLRGAPRGHAPDHDRPEPRHDFMHVDLGPAREWGTRWPVTAPVYTPEPPAPRPLASSRTMKGSGAAGLATVGAAGVEVAQEALGETQAALQPLVPYLDTLRWLFIAVALLGIGVAVYARWDDWRRGAAMIGGVLGCLAGSRWALAAAKWGTVGLTILLFLLSVRRAGERAGRMAHRLETLEKSNDVQRRMLEAAARRPRTRDELARRLRDGRLS